MLGLLKSKESKVIQASRKRLRNAKNDLENALRRDIEALKLELDGLHSEGHNENPVPTYSRKQLINILKCAVNAHLHLKLGKVKPSQLAILRYLNSADPSATTFSATCLRIFDRIEETNDTDMRVLHLLELQNIYLYLLSRLESL